MKLNLLLLLLVSLASTVFGANECNIYSAPIVKRLGIREPPPHTLDRISGQKHERDVAIFVNEQFRRHRHLTELLNSFFLSHPQTPLSFASQCVSNLNAIIESKAWVKLSKSNRTILYASERKLLRERLDRDMSRSESLVLHFIEPGSTSAPDVRPAATPVVVDNIPSPTYRRKKKNWSFIERQLGVDFDADAQRQQEYERQIAERQAYARQRDDAQFQLQEAERQRWFAEQQRIQAEQSARDNRIPSFQGGLDSQAEISRQQEMWAEQQKRDAEMRAHQFP